MPHPRLLMLLIVLCSVGVGRAARADTRQRYLAQFSDGTSKSTSWSPSWHNPTDKGESGAPLALLRDTHAISELRPPYLLLANGDVLPGTVVACEPRDPRFGHQPTLYVAPEIPLEALHGGQLPIRADRVQRIVTQPRLQPDAKAPQVMTTNGRHFTPRIVRWTNYGLSLLLEDGPVNINFAEIADAIFSVDRNVAAIEDCLAAGIESDARIARLTTRQGAAITGSKLYRYTEPVRERRRRRSEPIEPRVQVVLQPAWALEPLTILETSLCSASFRAAHQVPLAALGAAALVERGQIGAAFGWQRNQSVRGGALTSGTLEGDHGFGTHAHSEIRCDLPPGAAALDLWVGIDRASGQGGCVICRIVADEPKGRELWNSGHLRGSDGPRLVKDLDVRGLKSIVLITETAHANRPEGADPLDIRDDVAWLAPLVTLDSAKPPTLAALQGFLAGASGWNVSSEQLAAIKLRQTWNGFAGRWDPTLRLGKSQSLAWQRSIAVSPGNDIVEFVTAATVVADDRDFDLLVDGKRVPWSVSRDLDRMSREAARFSFRGPGPEVAKEEAPDDNLHYWWDLQAYRGQTVKVELRMNAAQDISLVWRSLALRGAIANLPANGKLPVPDVPLSSLEPAHRSSRTEREAPTLDVLPRGKQVPIRFIGQTYRGGYAIGRNSEIGFEVKPEYRKFVALVGTCTEQAGPLRILANGREIWQSPTRPSTDPAEWIEVAIPSGTTKLVIESGPDGGYYGFSALMHAGFER